MCRIPSLQLFQYCTYGTRTVIKHRKCESFCTISNLLLRHIVVLSAADSWSAAWQPIEFVDAKFTAEILILSRQVSVSVSEATVGPS